MAKRNSSIASDGNSSAQFDNYQQESSAATEGETSASGERAGTCVANIRKTQSFDFFPCNPDKQPLFAVRAGISFEDALNQASTFLASAKSVVRDSAIEANSDSLYAALHMVELAKAIVDAAATALLYEEAK